MRSRLTRHPDPPGARRSPRPDGWPHAAPLRRCRGPLQGQPDGARACTSAGCALMFSPDPAAPAARTGPGGHRRHHPGLAASNALIPTIPYRQCPGLAQAPRCPGPAIPTRRRPAPQPPGWPAATASPGACAPCGPGPAARPRRLSPRPARSVSPARRAPPARLEPPARRARQRGLPSLVPPQGPTPGCPLAGISRPSQRRTCRPPFRRTRLRSLFTILCTARPRLPRRVAGRRGRLGGWPGPRRASARCGMARPPGPRAHAPRARRPRGRAAGTATGAGRPSAAQGPPRGAGLRTGPRSWR